MMKLYSKNVLFLLLAIFSFLSVSAQDDFALRINTGGTETTYNGTTFNADAYSDTGSVLDRPQTGLPEPYQSFRFSRSQEMSYDIPVPDGEYIVNLYFAELWFGATGGGSGGVGSRVFDINIEGALAEDNLDVFAEVGTDAMLVKSFIVAVSGGILNIDFDARDAVGGERHPIINAIEILGDEQEQEELIVNDLIVVYNIPGEEEKLFTLNEGSRYGYGISQAFDYSGWPYTFGATTSDNVKSVKYEVTSPVELETGSNNAPFKMFSDGEPEPMDFINPNFYTITATPYSEVDFGGQQGESYTINFEIYDACYEDNIKDAIAIKTFPKECDGSGGRVEITAGDNLILSGENNDLVLNADLSILSVNGNYVWNASNLAPGTYYFQAATDLQGQSCQASFEFTIDEDECSEPNNFALRINTGGIETTYNGETFVADAYSNTGNTLDRPQTGLPEPYQSFRYSSSQQMSYDIPLEDGEYTVNLYFAELWFGATGGGAGGVGSRVFDVSIEGALAEDNLDVFAAVGADAMLMKSHTVTVTGGVLNIDFDSRDAVGGERHPIINAIEILGEASEPDEERPFVTTWKTDYDGVSNDNQIEIPAYPGETYNYTIEWGDGTSDDNVSGNIRHTYDIAGTYQISINGQFPRISLNGYIFEGNSYDDGNKIISIDQWGDIKWKSMESAFTYCYSLDVKATDSPDLSLVTSLNAMFLGCENLVGTAAFNSWDLSNITDTSSMFEFAKNFNQSIDNWNVSSVTNMKRMFYWVDSFNQPIGNWNVSSVTDMNHMFERAISFNQPIENWNVSNVTDMESMFNRADSFNQPLGNWNISKVKKMDWMFYSASSFNQDISDWNTSAVTTMQAMFSNTPQFNQNIGNWNVAKVKRMDIMFLNATSFNQDLSSWDVSSITQMDGMFNGATLSTENYDNLLRGWSQLQLQNNVVFDAGNSQYCDGEITRQKIINDFGWSILDPGKSENCHEPTNFALRINAGGTETEYNGETFVADAYFNAGNTLVRPQTGLPEPYQSFRYSRSQLMSYDIPVPDGEYTVNLYFAELWFGATGGGSGGAGSRVFDVIMEGQLVQDNLDIFAEVGADAMLEKSYTITVIDGILHIGFDSRDVAGGERHPVINGIEILGSAGSSSFKVWLEAECATIGSNWTLINDSSRSNGQYVASPVTQPVDGSLISDPDNLISFDIVVPEAGPYSVHALISGSSAELSSNGSVLYKINGSSTFIGGASVTSGFGWLQLWNTVLFSGNSPIQLVTGLNTIEIAYRGTGISLDKIYVTNSSDMPSGFGETDESCSAGISGRRAPIDANLVVLTPNPAITTTTLSFEKPVELTTIQLFDVLGRLVHSYNGPEVEDEGTYILQLNDLESGSYFINSIDTKGVIHQKQMVIKK